MTVMLSSDMLEATRLTRDGKLAEATALLQRALRGDSSAATPPARNTPGPSEATARIFDVDPETGRVTRSGSSDPSGSDGVDLHGARPTGKVRMPQLPDALRGFFGKSGETGTSRSSAPLPVGARFEPHSFTNDAGTRGYKLYTPAARGTAAMPLVVMLHGCTQSPDDFAAGTRMNLLAEEHGCLVAYPGQTQAANAQKCWNWFSPADQQRDRGEPALIAGITRQIMRDHAVDGRRVYVAGLSAGGAAAAIMGGAYPDLYAAVGVHSGLACGAARDMPSAFAAMRNGAPGGGARGSVPTIVFHADKDGTVHPRNGDQVIAQFSRSDSLRIEQQRGQVPGGHAYSRTQHLDAAGKPVLEQWVVHGGGHAWSGGSAAGSYTDPRGPDASREMLRFFLGNVLGGNPG